jgi:sugar phosphate isomerase/epimerase
MKLGFLIQSHENFEKWALFADGIGIPGIEIDYMGSGPYEFDTENTNKAFANKQVKPCAIGLWHINTIAKDTDERKKADDIIVNFLKYTAGINCPIAFMGAGTYEEGSTDRNIDELSKQHVKYNKMANDLGLSLVYYLGHKGNFINSTEIIARVTTALPDMKIKIDPVGEERNCKADPYELISIYGARISHFHCKDVIRYKNNFEIEPPVGMGDIAWNRIIGMLYHHGYNGYLTIEPHGSLWGKPDAKAGHILLSKKHLEQFIL